MIDRIDGFWQVEGELTREQYGEVRGGLEAINQRPLSEVRPDVVVARGTILHWVPFVPTVDQVAFWLDDYEHNHRLNQILRFWVKGIYDTDLTARDLIDEGYIADLQGLRTGLP